MTDSTITALTNTVLGTASGSLIPDVVPPNTASAEPFLSNGPDASSTSIPIEMNNIYNQFIAQASYQYRL